MSNLNRKRARKLAMLGLVIVAGVVVFFATRGEMMSQEAASLDSGRWTLVEIDGTPVAAENAPYFEVSEGLITGNDGCNAFSGPLAEPGKIRLGQRGCPDTYTALPLNMSDPMGQIDQAVVEDRTLTMPTSDGGVATFQLTEAE